MNKLKLRELLDQFHKDTITPPDLIELFSYLLKKKDPATRSVHTQVGQTAMYLVSEEFMHSDGTLLDKSLQIMGD